MRRIKKLHNAKMISARIEESRFDEFKSLLQKQTFLTIQDFMTYAVDLFLEDTIIIEKNAFKINSELYEKKI